MSHWPHNPRIHMNFTPMQEVVYYKGGLSGTPITLNAMIGNMESRGRSEMYCSFVDVWIPQDDTNTAGVDMVIPGTDFINCRMELNQPSRGNYRVGRLLDVDEYSYRIRIYK